MEKRILVLKGENKLDVFLNVLDIQKRSMKHLPDYLKNGHFTFSDGKEINDVSGYSCVTLLSNPDSKIWKILEEAEKLNIPTINSRELIEKFNDCLQTQLDLQNWGFTIPKLGDHGRKKLRHHNRRKYGYMTFKTGSNDFNEEEYYYEEQINGDLFKVKVLGKQEPFVISIGNNGNSNQRIDRTSEYPLLGELGLDIAEKIDAEILSIDFILEKSTNTPYCIDVNLGNAFSGVYNNVVHILTYLANNYLN